MKLDNASRMPAKAKGKTKPNQTKPNQTKPNQTPGTSPPRADLIFPVHIEQPRRIGCARIEPAK
ncbi:hypothetical protein [Paraburkholderia caribensis]|uniref:hypothetical protein n=1 Tax=Paraburkholderia caribensis TaxID=75105 RepID=UPI001D08F21E|nr:hypothetical protein [Paraburkholderia caribensis]